MCVHFQAALRELEPILVFGDDNVCQRNLFGPRPGLEQFEGRAHGSDFGFNFLQFRAVIAIGEASEHLPLLDGLAFFDGDFGDDPFDFSSHLRVLAGQDPELA